MTDFDYSAIGLEPRDKIVYEALYSMDNVSLRAIAQSTGMNRGTVYEIIKKLTGLGLVTFTQTGERRRYSAARPEVFLSLIREQRDQLLQLETATAGYIKELEASSPLPGAGHFASFYEGEEGVAAILRDVLQTMRETGKKEYHVFSSKRASSFIYNNFRGFSRQRVKNGIFVRVISDQPSHDRAGLAERRQLPVSREALNGYTIVYGNKTALISIGEANVLSAVVVTDAGVANMQRLIFEQLWSTLRV
jgi:sugar-specific transcriptional regulator TrmB